MALTLLFNVPIFNGASHITICGVRMLVLSSLFGSTVAPHTKRLSNTSTDSPKTESCNGRRSAQWGFGDAWCEGVALGWGRD